MSNTSLSRWRQFRDAAAVPTGVLGVLFSLLGIVLAIVAEQYAAGTFWLVLGEIITRDQQRYLERREQEERRALFRRITAPKQEPRS